jgi:hypothetical protein
MENLSHFTEGLGIWLTCLLTLAVFSFLYRDNPVYKLAEHIYVGVAAGYYFYQAFRGTVYPNLIAHVADGIDLLQKGDPAGWNAQWRWGALVLGLLVLSRLFPKISWISRWPMALVVGAFAGLNLLGFAQANLIDQINGTFLPLGGQASGIEGTMPFLPPKHSPGEASLLNHIILVAGVLTVLTYFFFSANRPPVLARVGQVGIAFVMLTFGATYGSIVLARISLLIGRVQTLEEANRPEYWYPPIVSAVLIIVLLAIWRTTFFRPSDEAIDETETASRP